MKSRRIDNQTLALYCFMLFSLDEKKKIKNSAYQHGTSDRGILMCVVFFVCVFVRINITFFMF